MSIVIVVLIVFISFKNLAFTERFCTLTKYTHGQSLTSILVQYHILKFFKKGLH